MSDSDGWCTPPEITEPLEQFFCGHVDVDPCSNERSIVKSRVAYSSGGLIRPWRLPNPANWSVYQNDPYSQSGVWTDKMLYELASGNVHELVRLCMMSTSTQWWEAMCNTRYLDVPGQTRDCREIRNPKILGIKRVAFLDWDPERIAKRGSKLVGCRFEPALVYFGQNPQEFSRAFSHLTRWSTWGR